MRLQAFLLLCVLLCGCGTQRNDNTFSWIKNPEERAMRKQLWHKLESTTFPVHKVTIMGFEDALVHLRETSRKHDPGLPPHSGAGVRFGRVNDSSVYSADKLTFDFEGEEVTLLKYIRFICEAAGTRWRISGDTVFISGDVKFSEQPDAEVQSEGAPSD